MRVETIDRITSVWLVVFHDVSTIWSTSASCGMSGNVFSHVSLTTLRIITTNQIGNFLLTLLNISDYV